MRLKRTIRHGVRFLSMRYVVAVLVACAAAQASAVEPAVRAVNLRGLQIGAATTLIVDGDDLGAAPRLMLPFDAKQVLKSGSTDKRALFDVTLGEAVVPGYYNLRIVTDGGVSPPLLIAVDRLLQQPLAAESPQLPAALHGTVAGSAIVETKFAGRAGQSVTVEVEAARLGGKLRPVVHLYESDRAQVAWSWPTRTLFGDTRLTVVLPADGTYTVALHDLEYAAPGGGFFRMRIGQWSYVDRVFPAVLTSASHGSVELLGSRPQRHVELSVPADVVAVPLAPDASGIWSGPRPFVAASSFTELVEPGAWPNPHELPAPPVGVSGRLAKPGEEDRYRLTVTPGMKLRFELFAERNGSSLDAALVLRDNKGTQLARAEDGPNTIDPLLEYAVPAGTTSLVIGVVDAQGRGRAGDADYHLIVESPSEPMSDYRLTTTADHLSLPVGGRAVVPVLVERRGYTGGIDLTAAPLPANVKLSGNQIPPDAEGALVTVERTGEMPAAVVTSLRGRAPSAPVRTVMVKGHAAERSQPWLAAEFALAPAASAGVDFQIDWRDLPADARLVPTKNMKLPVKVTRSAANAAFAVRLTLLTSQSPPLLANGQPDQPKTLRAEKAVELGAKAVEGEIALVVPADLASTTYDVTVLAELLAADKRTVTAAAYAPVKRLAVVSPVAVMLSSPENITATLDAKSGATLRLSGKVRRSEGAAGDVVVTLVGLPAGVAAAPATVKAGSDDFTIAVPLPATTPAGKLTGLKLSATTAPDPKQPNVRVRSRDVELTVVVEPAKK